MTRREAKPVITLRVEPGPATPAARESWRRWWRARVAEVRADGQAQAEARNQADHKQAHHE